MKVMCTTVMVLALLLLAVFEPVAVAVQFINGWEVYTREDGLPSNDIIRVFVDDNGLKWFISGFDDNGLRQGALCTFDDENWAYFPSLGILTDITADSEGNVWVAEAFAGPRRFKDGAFEKPIGQEYDGHRVDILTSLDFDLDGRLWVTGWGACASCYSPESAETEWRHFCDFPQGNGPPNRIFKIKCDPNGDVWIGYDLGLLRLRIASNSHSWKRFLKDTGWCTDVDVDSEGTKWADTWRGVHRSVDGRVWQPMGFSANAITALGDSGVIFGSHGGAYWYDYDQWRWIEAWTPDVWLGDAALDYQTGDLWFAAYEDGVGVLRGWLYSSRPPMVLSLATDRGQYTVGEPMILSVDLLSEGEARNPGLGSGWVPFASGLALPAGLHLENYELFTLTLPELPAGTYHWYAACTHAGSMDFASNIASCEWQFE